MSRKHNFSRNSKAAATTTSSTPAVPNPSAVSSPAQCLSVSGDASGRGRPGLPVNSSVSTMGGNFANFLTATGPQSLLISTPTGWPSYLSRRHLLMSTTWSLEDNPTIDWCVVNKVKLEHLIQTGQCDSLQWLAPDSVSGGEGGGREGGREVMMMVIMGRICLYIDTLSSHTHTGILSCHLHTNFQWKLL